METNGSQRWVSLWRTDEELFHILFTSGSLERARHRVLDHLEALDRGFCMDIGLIPPWDLTLRREALGTLRDILSPRNELLAGSSVLEVLLHVVHEGDAAVDDGFVMEVEHLLKAAHGRAEVYPSPIGGEPVVHHEPSDGRVSARDRSSDLDDLARRMDEYMSRYPSGLEPAVVELRSRNRERILDALGGTPGQWEDWHWQFAHVLKEPEDLGVIRDLVGLEPEEDEAIDLALEHGVPFGVTPYYLHLMDPRASDRDYAVRRQVFPSLAYVHSMVAHREDRSTALDFMGERDTSPVDLITRRYPRINILKPYDACPQICVYCQRNWSISRPLDPSAKASSEELERAIQWIDEHGSINEVLVTGGDPLVLGDSHLDSILDRLSHVEHVTSLRIGTRTFVTVPQRLTDGLVEVMGAYHEPPRRTISLVTHVEHPYEVTPETADAVARVRSKGIMVYNQQVFTIANSRRFETAALRVALKGVGIDPYYCFNMKGKAEMADYAAPIARLLQERKEEARLLPGLVRTDEAVFNIPRLGKNHLVRGQDHELIGIRHDGRRVYSFHPWEKNVYQVEPYVHTDVSIKDYLERLTERGEDPRDYRSIWYYH